MRWDIIYRIEGRLSKEDKTAIESLDDPTAVADAEDNHTIVGIKLDADYVGYAVTKTGILIRIALKRNFTAVAVNARRIDQ